MRLLHIALIIACLIPGAGQAQDYPARKFLQDEIERWSGLVARYGVSVD